MPYKTQPLILTDLTPDDIAGGKMGMVEQHYKAVKETNGEEDFYRARRAMMKQLGWTQQDLEDVREIYKELREHGYFPGGVGQHGNVKWMVALKCAFHAPETGGG